MENKVISEEEKRKLKKDLDHHYNLFKKRLKLRSKNELVGMLWEQILQFKELQEIAKELYEENKQLKESSNA